MIWNEEGFLVPTLDNSFNEDAIKLCPFNPNPEDEVKDEDILANQIFPEANQNDLKIGRFENTYVGYANEFRETSSSGGIATYIFEQLLEKKIVDHLFIVKEINGTYQYQWFNQVNQIKQISKTRYIPVTLERLFKEIDEKQGKVAVSGVACFVKAIRLKQHYNPQYKEKIPFVLGIICGGLKSKFFTDYLSQSAGIKDKFYNQQYRIKDAKSTALDYSFGAFNKDNIFKTQKMSPLGDMWGTGVFKSNACDFCDDVATELADISLGDAWLPEYKNDGLGNSIIITRSTFADDLIKEGINNKVLSVENIDKSKVIESQNASFRHRQDSIYFRNNLIGKKAYYRKRFKKDNNIYVKIIQLGRRNTRKQSINIWKQFRDKDVYNNKMYKHLKLLALFNKINKKFNK
ncbi:MULTISPECIES: Coenzyme F420 hydrogenase/dehydrogenase, beta subunit C-terminal domain [unclassified Empedobacter]|uniref:Coenzyme F420 hydrogenase/dehydrogenase, beta subunit C-terminal domain n=1 Tax=unclassified Empedobacter TaxID=2643773 RepID=UPI0025C01F4E|nr:MULTISPECIES: Coenzyme F420 hydrogenase/dehydrogenase, beta subunit C-terminal domain [unclassified Empedobacter]